MRKQTPVVLILEDNDQARFVIRAVLENAGYNVVDVENESLAIAVCARTEQQIDLLISDVILSSAKGTEVAQRIVSLRPALPILFISGFGADDLVSRGLLKPNQLPSTRTAFLQKPFGPQTLLDSIHTLVPQG